MTKMTGKGRASPAVLFDVWGQRGWANVEVVGESHYSQAIQALLPQLMPDASTETVVPVTVRHDANNQYDKNAVEVSASSGLLGYLSREDAVRYAPVLAHLQNNGLLAATTARVWGYLTEDWDTNRMKFTGSVRVDLAEPNMLVPINLPPVEQHVVLPIGSAIQVTGEENHLTELGPYLRQEGEAWLYATLHELVVTGPRSSKTLVEIHIDGTAVGQLTPAMSTSVLPVVNYLAEQNTTTAVRAIVKGNRLRADVVLYTLRAAELDDAWFAALTMSSDRGVVETGSPTQIETVAPSGGAAASGETVSANLSADWYSDPLHVARLRYWDGATWTEHTAPYNLHYGTSSYQARLRPVAHPFAKQSRTRCADFVLDLLLRWWVNRAGHSHGPAMCDQLSGNHPGTYGHKPASKGAHHEQHRRVSATGTSSRRLDQRTHRAAGRLGQPPRTSSL